MFDGHGFVVSDTYLGQLQSSVTAQGVSEHRLSLPAAVLWGTDVLASLCTWIGEWEEGN